MDSYSPLHLVGLITRNVMMACGVLEVHLHTFFTTALDGSERLALTSRSLFLWGTAPVSFQRKAGWTPVSVWTLWRREKPRTVAEYRTECLQQWSLKPGTCTLPCSESILRPLNVTSFAIFWHITGALHCKELHLSFAKLRCPERRIAQT